jgi:hypothetical protein
MKYLETGLNVKLLKSLLGEDKNSQNTIYICGEARTNCVKSSAIDLLEYAETNAYDQSKIVFIKNASSPIIGVENDILRKMTGIGSNAQQIEQFIADEDKTLLSRKTYDSYYKMYSAKAMTTDDIINLLNPKQTFTSGGNRRRRTRKVGGQRRRSHNFANKRSRSKKNRRTKRRK